MKLDSDLLGMTCLAAIWGITNTFIANATREQKKNESDSTANTPLLLRPLHYLIQLIKNWRFTLPFLINQSASLLFLAYVIKTDLSKAVCTINSLTLIFTIISGSVIFKEPINFYRVFFGSIFIISGLYLMSNY